MVALVGSTSWPSIATDVSTLLLQLSEQLFGFLEVLVVVDRALEHLDGLLVVALSMAHVAQVVEHLGLRDRRAFVEALKEQRLEGLLGAIDVVLRRRTLVVGVRELEREDAEIPKDDDGSGIDLE